MKIFILTVVFILLLFRIKGIPTALSKTLWKKKMLKTIEENKFLNIKPLSEDSVNLAILILLLFELLLIIFYIVTGNLIDVKIISILTVLKITISLYSIKLTTHCIKNIYSTNIEDFNFHRIYGLLSVIVDYVYYILVICILLN